MTTLEKSSKNQIANQGMIDVLKLMNFTDQPAGQGDPEILATAPPPDPALLRNHHHNHNNNHHNNDDHARPAPILQIAAQAPL